MQKFFFDMKDGVPMRDRVGTDFKGNLEAIEHCKKIGPSTSATTACATMKTLRYPSSTRSDVRLIVSSFTAIEPHKLADFFNPRRNNAEARKRTRRRDRNRSARS